MFPGFNSNHPYTLIAGECLLPCIQRHTWEEAGKLPPTPTNTNADACVHPCLPHYGGGLQSRVVPSCHHRSTCAEYASQGKPKRDTGSGYAVVGIRPMLGPGWLGKHGRIQSTQSVHKLADCCSLWTARHAVIARSSWRYDVHLYHRCNVTPLVATCTRPASLLPSTPPLPAPAVRQGYTPRHTTL